MALKQLELEVDAPKQCLVLDIIKSDVPILVLDIIKDEPVIVKEPTIYDIFLKWIRLPCSNMISIAKIGYTFNYEYYVLDWEVRYYFNLYSGLNIQKGKQFNSLMQQLIKELAARNLIVEIHNEFNAIAYHHLKFNENPRMLIHPKDGWCKLSLRNTLDAFINWTESKSSNGVDNALMHINDFKYYVYDNEMLYFFNQFTGLHIKQGTGGFKEITDEYILIMGRKGTKIEITHEWSGKAYHYLHMPDHPRLLTRTQMKRRQIGEGSLQPTISDVKKQYKNIRKEMLTNKKVKDEDKEEIDIQTIPTHKVILDIISPQSQEEIDLKAKNDTIDKFLEYVSYNHRDFSYIHDKAIKYEVFTHDDINPNINTDEEFETYYNEILTLLKIEACSCQESLQDDNIIQYRINRDLNIMYHKNDNKSRQEELSIIEYFTCIERNYEICS